ncbi:type VI secretion system baseplate subunit TssE [Noviherbaspirillum sp.]|uniref:type VI secretion system baseplate subunit TssE n=1 Tax=Noviherbaspirillum sp. TaxID=1926288 RepID=UPI002D69BA61|nr:type VI secretion system baseplate subunit TssE [Noviherbaspirillum sp.]HZW19947.1 type VI secretion system baseplate subunit TssE [Noviherbaspirillum sp.]
MSADLYSRDRLQPALIDRLIDDAPQDRQEAPETKAISRSRLREIVLRDLSWLFNATAPLGAVDERRYPQARHSVLNYGMPCLSGKLASRVELFDLEQTLRQAILDFEPRILPASLAVTGRQPEDELGHHNVLQFEITGELWAQPYPVELWLRTDVDFETGMVKVQDGKLSASALRAPGAT